MDTTDTDHCLLEYEAVEQWRERFASSMFATRASLSWFIRTHRKALVECGALILGAGRSGNLVHRRRMVDAVQRIRHADSLTRMAREQEGLQ